MKKVYLIAALTFLAFTSCQKKENDASEDIVVTSEDTTQVVQDGVTTDSTTVENDSTGKGKLLDKISVTTVKTNPAKGKYTLAETKWILTELRGKAVTNTSGKDYVLNLDSKTGKFSTYVGCNSFSGNYLMKDAGLLSFSMVAGTKMACPNMDFENDYMKALDKVNSYMIEGNMLHLHRGNRVFAMFEAAK